MFTNLIDRNKYPITAIINLYHDRWKIEEYYNFQKNYLKLDHMHFTKEKDLNILMKCQLFVSKLVYYIQHIFEKKCQNGKYVINKHHILNGLFDTHILYNLIRNIDVDKTISIFINEYVVKVRTQRGKSYKIQCINPVGKSYRKYESKKNIDEKNKQSQIT